MSTQYKPRGEYRISPVGSLGDGRFVTGSRLYESRAVAKRAAQRVADAVGCDVYVELVDGGVTLDVVEPESEEA